LLKDRVLEVGESWRPASEWPEVARRSIRKSYPTSSLVASAPRGAWSEREFEVLGLMAEGLTNAGIAERLVISDRTVESHVRRLFIKLDIPESTNEHRRVLAVLAHLRGVEPS
jgi:DNA-binding NarL/FixJ family response regulator